MAIQFPFLLFSSTPRRASSFSSFAAEITARVRWIAKRLLGTLAVGVLLVTGSGCGSSSELSRFAGSYQLAKGSANLESSHLILEADGTFSYAAQSRFTLDGGETWLHRKSNQSGTFSLIEDRLQLKVGDDSWERFKFTAGMLESDLTGLVLMRE